MTDPSGSEMDFREPRLGPSERVSVISLPGRGEGSLDCAPGKSTVGPDFGFVALLSNMQTISSFDSVLSREWGQASGPDSLPPQENHDYVAASSLHGPRRPILRYLGWRVCHRDSYDVTNTFRYFLPQLTFAEQFRYRSLGGISEAADSTLAGPAQPLCKLSHRPRRSTQLYRHGVVT